jgi:hypothetical protein
MKALVLTPNALFRLSQFSITADWFDRYGLPEHNAGLKRVVVNNIVYILDVELQTDEGAIVVIQLSAKDGVFSDETSRSTVLERIITAARSVYTTSVVIPTGWRRHKEGSVFSIQASSRDNNWRARIHFDMNPKDSKDLFVFNRSEDTEDFAKLDRHIDIYIAARAGFTDAVLTAPQPAPEDSRAGITLSQRLPQGFVQGATLDQWYKSKLTAEQRTFVDKKHDGPVRLRGSAGTGKTLALVVKFLRDALGAEAGSEPVKLGFLTHSFASVDLVSAIGESLDTTGLFHGQGKRATLEVRTLYDLAHTNLNFELDHLKPLSLDGREGRRLQFELIEAVLKETGGSPIARAHYRDISPALEGWANVAANKSVVAEIMNEFASVLDAEGIRAGEEKGERYAKGVSARPAWLLSLPKEIDRRFILDVHRRYRKLLGDMNTLSVDQMVADFNSFLDSNRWDRIRHRDGYDALFVDELHLFTSIERQSLHKLIRKNVEDDGRPRRPPIFMAYDLKQSPRDTFAQYGEGDQNLFTASTGLQGAELVKLDRVFRYTPQIAEFLADLDATFPAIDIPGEWDAYAGKAELADGDKPELVVFRDEVSLFSTVFSEAQKVARSIDGGGRRVAVLCASEEQFDKYVKAAAGQFADRHLPITSREPSSELRHAGKRFIFSMPEYVAGLQFDTVFLIHVDAVDAPLDAGDGVRRRFISNIYLGSSRAEKTLRISACLSRGGKSDVLDMALDRKSLKEVPPPVRAKRK